MALCSQGGAAAPDLHGLDGAPGCCTPLPGGLAALSAAGFVAPPGLAAPAGFAPPPGLTLPPGFQAPPGLAAPGEGCASAPERFTVPPAPVREWNSRGIVRQLNSKAKRLTIEPCPCPGVY
ncbi:unnamed protein product [Prorocentrum cordatum]|uniref:Uncharacterized protein n=1 Tax=Prorocentrum cordatum TaxID=2364126 RepID=A0ABN9UF70_9DINO|nr:unnamed protein product [Polarella glacialis]